MGVLKMRCLRSLARIYPGLALFGRTIAGRGEFEASAVSVKDIGPSAAVMGPLTTVRLPHPEDAARYRIERGDVLVAVRGTVPKVAVASERLAGAVLTATLAGVRLDEGLLLPEVLAAYLRSDLGQSAILAMVRSATGQIALTVRDIGSLEVPVPPMEVQRRVVAMASELNSYEEYTAQALELRRQVTQQLVAGLLAGERNA
ncbi:MAG TPA: hypothetical protein VEZ14_14305 [Dehalococcoidia bacterium]|nr:hypothetical protein [Dehalococcoidia bacterium]